MTHCVYYIYDADDWLLYIGCSANVEQRLRSHRSSKPWRKHIDHVTTSKPMAEADALAFESEEIRRLAPMFNVRDNPIGRLLDDEWWAGLYAERQDGMYYPDLATHIKRYSEQRPMPVHSPRFTDPSWFESLTPLAVSA